MDNEKLDRANLLTKEIGNLNSSLRQVALVRSKITNRSSGFSCSAGISGCTKMIDVDVLEIALFVQEKRDSEELSALEKEFGKL